jgi:6-phosphogluconolactonase
MIRAGRLCARWLAFSLLFFSLISPITASDGRKSSYILFVGTYTENDSKGIYAYRFNSETAELTPLGLAAETPNPSFLAIDPNRRFVYAVNEVANYRGDKSGAISAFAIDRKAGNGTTSRLSLVNEAASRGADPCYITFDKTGKYVLVANYTGGSIAVFPVKAGGHIGESTAFVQHAGSSVNRERQASPHAHWIETTPDNRFAIAVDLGIDELLVYRFNAKTGTLHANNPPYAKLDAGAGPRHLAFHPNGKFAYIVNELNSTVTEFTFNSKLGELHKEGSVSTLPQNFTGENSTAEIKVHPNGKFLYISNRGHDSIAIFAIDSQTGALTPVDYAPTQGKAPRHFEIDPSGKFLLVANQETSNIVAFRIDPKTGLLTHIGKDIQVPNPVCLKFMAED